MHKTKVEVTNMPGSGKLLTLQAIDPVSLVPLASPIQIAEGEEYVAPMMADRAWLVTEHSTGKLSGSGELSTAAKRGARS